MLVNQQAFGYPQIISIKNDGSGTVTYHPLRELDTAKVLITSIMFSHPDIEVRLMDGENTGQAGVMASFVSSVSDISIPLVNTPKENYIEVVFPGDSDWAGLCVWVTVTIPYVFSI